MSGKLFVIEGLDSSGKQTQSNLLFEKLKKNGVNAMKVEYPNYKSPSSSLVKMYLGGEFGTNPDDVSPYISSTFYAADRYASYKTEYETFYKNGGIILCDRYTTSNMLHQGSKLENALERDEFLCWLLDLEYNIYKIPVPAQVFFLDVPAKKSIELMKDRENKITHETKKDIHESAVSYLYRTYECSKYLVEKYSWERICCVEDNSLRSIEDINNELWEKFVKYL